MVRNPQLSVNLHNRFLTKTNYVRYDGNVVFQIQNLQWLSYKTVFGIFDYNI